MNVSQLSNPQRRAVYVQRLKKLVFKRFRQKSSESTPIFVFGMQRSGTSMLMNVLHLRSDTDVYDENKKNRAFLKHRLRSFQTIHSIVDDSPAQYVCFKPIADSHRIESILSAFPHSCAIWIYRHFQDVANSRLLKFPEPTRAIRLICNNEPGGGWFAEGVSNDSRNILQSVYHDNLSDFDYACLTWWARNRIYVERNLNENKKVALISYERLVTDPQNMFGKLFDALGMSEAPRSHRHVHRASVGKTRSPRMDPSVRTLCMDLHSQLDACQL